MDKIEDLGPEFELKIKFPFKQAQAVKLLVGQERPK
jgi:hypothetical protein